MSDILQRIAAIHRERVANNEKKRLGIKKKLERRQAYFKDTGLLEMWDDVKNIKIPNPVPDALEGLTISLGALLVETAQDNIEKTGFVVYGKDDTLHEWCIDYNGDFEGQKETAAIWYRVNSGKTCFALQAENTDAKKRFTDSFVKWLSRYITPHILLDMDIDLDTPSVVKRSRKILQLAET